MSDSELLRVKSPGDLARLAANQWLEKIRTAGGAAPISVALSGGRIARTFFEAVTETVKKGGIDLKRVHFFWGDERCVPPTDPESNFGIARDLLLTPLGIAAGQIHRIRGEAPPETAAMEAAAELVHLVPVNSSRQPIIDLVFLGLGENGHVASLFPEESEAEMANPAIYRAVVATKPPPRRITLGYDALAAAREIWVLASGSGKEDALRESLAPNGQTPLARVVRGRDHTRIYVDFP